MLLIKILILLLLLWIFIQDIVSRAVYWLLFPVLVILMTALDMVQQKPVTDLWRPVIINLGFLTVQFLVVSAWFSVRKRQWVNVTAELIGWGDILLLLCIAFYLSVLNFLFFYIASLVIVLLIWLPWQLFFPAKNKHIPLAGLQALFFVLFLAGDWWFSLIKVTNDDWLQQLLMK